MSSMKVEKRASIWLLVVSFGLLLAFGAKWVYEASGVVKTNKAQKVNDVYAKYLEIQTKRDEVYIKDYVRWLFLRENSGIDVEDLKQDARWYILRK